jgi:dihydrofolate synthase/folylpolyglutamate synthase
MPQAKDVLWHSEYNFTERICLPRMTSIEILEKFRRDHARNHAQDINLALRPEYLDLLARLGNPQHKLPPVFHVAGTNGKGSVCAFLRAMLEAEGYRVHVYTSPHLVHFHERIRIAGALIDEEELTNILSECQRLAAPGAITYFEAATAAAFCAFARHPADFVLLEVGLGGRLDATNLIEKPLASIITRISYDHRDYLGNTLAGIAREKAGIMRKGIACFSAPQPDAEAHDVLHEAALSSCAPLFMGGEDWHIEIRGDGFRFKSAQSEMDLPPPALAGEHQFWNAGLAVAALSVLSRPLPRKSIARGLLSVEWPARLQKIEQGALYECLPEGWELWLDGGHNDSAGTALAAQAKSWREQNRGAPRPLHLICGMLASKSPREFLTPLAPYTAGLQTVTMQNEAASFTADALAAEARAAGIKNAVPSPGLAQALNSFAGTNACGRILVCGSLYLAGEFLRLNELALSGKLRTAKRQ